MKSLKRTCTPSEGFLGKVSFLDIHRIWKRYFLPLTYFKFCSCMGMCKNTTLELCQSPCSQEETRLRIKSISGKVRRKTERSQVLVKSVSSLINLNALPLNYILSVTTNVIIFWVTQYSWVFCAKFHKHPAYTCNCHLNPG